MAEPNSNVNQLLNKLELLAEKQFEISREISQLRKEIDQLRKPQKQSTIENEGIILNKTFSTSETEFKNEIDFKPNTSSQTASKTPASEQSNFASGKQQVEKSDLEKFIGENLINKLGIAITIIGVAIGAKYSIDNELISPLTRIILGYLVGLVLLGFGFGFKSKYPSYSAVLVSGAMTIMYFITFFAYQFYQLIPLGLSFSLMTLLTVFTVVAALNYNREFIAQLGLVGAYAVPFLLDNGSGEAQILFGYIIVINVGILVISFKKNWKLLNYISFGFTWIIFISWFISRYKTPESDELAFIFVALFFAKFYFNSLAPKFIRKENFAVDDILQILLNSLLFFSIGYIVLGNNTIGKQFLGIFTLANSVMHFVVGLLVYRQKHLDRNIYFFISSLVIVFVTIAVPIQLNGNWVTLLWVVEASFLFWLGRTKNVPFFEKISLPLMLFAFASLFYKYLYDYFPYSSLPSTNRQPIFLNENFLTALIFIVIFILVNILNSKKHAASTHYKSRTVYRVIQFIIPSILIIVAYWAFRVEIEVYWAQLYNSSEIKIFGNDDEYFYQRNYDLKGFRVIWVLGYTMFFFTLLSIINLRKIKSLRLMRVTSFLMAVTLVVFLVQGLSILGSLRESYLEQTLSQYFERGIINLWIRYIAFTLLAVMIYSFYLSLKKWIVSKSVKVIFELLLCAIVLWILSDELMNWLNIIGIEQAGKLGLSILWGIYSLSLIIYGIWKKNKAVRIGAFVLFGVTLVKLFVYDLIHLNTLARTGVFVALGVLLLMISFLYNKYKYLMSSDD